MPADALVQRGLGRHLVLRVPGFVEFGRVHGRIVGEPAQSATKDSALV
jgi:hypothetical protein